MVIYKATLPNGKCYIGCTSRVLSERVRGHKSLALNKKSELPFHKAIRKYEFSSIVWEVIFETSSHEELLLKEIELISLNNTLVPNGYNVTLGGEGTLGLKHNLGKKRTEAQKMRLREINKKNSKPVVLVNCETNECIKFDSIGELCRANNLPYSQVKKAFGRKESYFNFKIILQTEFNPDDVNLFKLGFDPKTKFFKITNGTEVIEISGINSLRRLLDISERTARNMYYKNLKVNGWEKVNGRA